jgi:hypothetical protein
MVIAIGANGDGVLHWRHYVHHHWSHWIAIGTIFMSPLAPMAPMARTPNCYDTFAQNSMITAAWLSLLSFNKHFVTTLDYFDLL